MKNTTKKILSMLLAVIMLLSVMPVAYAERATYSPEVEQYIEIMLRIVAYGNNLYESGYGHGSDEDGKDLPNEDLDKVTEIVNDALHEFVALGYNELPEPTYENIKNIDMKTVPDFNRIMKPAIDEVEAKIASGEIKVVINTYELVKYYYSGFIYHSEDEYNRIVDYIGNNEKYAELGNIAMDSLNEMLKYRDDPNVKITQAEFDLIFKEKFRPFYDIFINCLDGNHLYGEYISNNDATEEADGTKTATCEFCGATDTVIDEGSKLVREPASFIEMIIAFFRMLIEKIRGLFS